NLDGQQQSSSVSSQFVTSMLNPTPDARIESIFQTSSRMDVQPQTIVATLPLSEPTLTPSTIATSDRLRDKAQAENDEFLKTVDENMHKIIKEQVNEQVKVQVSKILPKIEQTMNEQLEAEVLTQSSNSSKTSYALVEAYESDKIILDTYGDTVTLKRRRDDDVDKDEEPSAGSDRGSKRRREGKEPESASAPKKKATRSASKSTQGSKSRQTLASESATAEEPMQTTHEMEEPSHPEFETGADDQLMAEPSQHLEWFSLQKKPPTPYRDWNKTLPTTHKSIQSWISKLAKQTDSRSCFNELMDTPVDFSAFLMNQLKVDTLTSELIVIQMRMEDLQLGVESYQKKLNLTRLDTYRSDMKCKEAYIAYSNPRGFIYQNKDKQNRLMRTIWRKSDKERAAAMIQAIDKQLKTMMIMRSLERFVGGSLYEGDFRMLQQTI
nr:hypothetical protein [Tanacetum cinerariifolium]